MAQIINKWCKNVIVKARNVLYNGMGGGSMSQKPKKIAVIGGANMDIGGFSACQILDGDSNPGRVSMTIGGVGRNIAENLVRMGLQAELVSAIGGDANGRAILADCAQKGIGTSLCLVKEDMRSSVYLFISDPDGDMHCAVNDMEIQAQLTPQVMAERIDALNRMDAAVIDANLPSETIEYLAKNLTIPLFADAVSAAKVLRLKNALPYLYAFKPNRIEAELLTGIPIRSAADAQSAAQAMVQAGVRQVYLSMSVEGAVCAEQGRCLRIPGRKLHMVNSTGAGDAFTAALVWACLKGFSLKESCMAGMAAASIAVETVCAVNPEMSEQGLLMRIQQLMCQEEQI